MTDSEDMRAHRLIEDAARALRKLLDDDYTVRQLRYQPAGDAHVALDDLEEEAARNVKRWD